MTVRLVLLLVALLVDCAVEDVAEEPVVVVEDVAPEPPAASLVVVDADGRAVVRDLAAAALPLLPAALAGACDGGGGGVLYATAGGWPLVAVVACDTEGAGP